MIKPEPKPSIEDLLAVANAPEHEPPDPATVRKAKRELESLAVQYRGRLVSLDATKSVATFHRVLGAANFADAALRHFKALGLPFTPSRVGGEVRITWS